MVYMEKLVLIDGHSILNRAFYGIPDLTNSKGFHTNAILGFLNILFRILEEEKPDYLTVAFDVHAPTFRHQRYKEYKGTRKPMPQELREQIPVMKEVLQAMGIKIMEKAGLEADDILGTIAKRAEKDGICVSLVSGDRDLLQIATDCIKIRIPKTKGGKTEIEDYYAKDVEEAYQVTPIQFIDLKALMGDTADNIPGVPKVGQKTATDLIVQYGSVENLYGHIEEITKKAIKESLINNRELADLSKELATIEVHAEIEYTYEDARVGEFFTPDAYLLFKQLELKSYYGRFENTNQMDTNLVDKFEKITDLSEAELCFQKLCENINKYDKEKKKYPISILTFVDEISQEFLGLAIADEEHTIYISAEGFLTEAYLMRKVEELLKCENTCLITNEMKAQYRFFQLPGIENRCFDISIAAYLLDPLKNHYELADMAGNLLQIVIPDRNQLMGKDSFAAYEQKEPEQFFEYACFCAYVCLRLYPVLQEQMEEQQSGRLFWELEMPLTRVLYDMEKEGILVEALELASYGEHLLDHINRLEETIYEKTGTVFNINSPKQLGEVLFEKMGIPGGKKTKTGYSTAADVLEKLAFHYPVVGDILDYRTYAKLKSTYADGLAQFIGSDQRIHSTFQQTITATGRLSSTDPNLQNIPMKTDLGRQIRKVFVPKEGFVFVDADYSQIELRVLAHMANDKNLLEAYKLDQDIHRITASKVFGVPFEEVTDLQRRNAKAVNFGIVYGISSFGLSQDLSISTKEAKAYIDQYFATYPGIKEFLDKSVNDAKKQGFVTTLFGRRRPVPELSSSNFMQRAFGERVAMNSPIQGTAADIIKIAMLKVWKRLADEKLKSRLILQIHDELLIEAAEDEVEIVKEILKEEMQGAVALSVALEIDVHTGNNWYEAK